MSVSGASNVEYVSARVRARRASLFEEEKRTIAAGTWENDEPIEVLARSLDADRDGSPEQIRYHHARTGALLLQLGTPAAPTSTAVRPYLREFLSDPRVIDIPWLPRKLLLEGAILPFRPRASAAAYASIWRPEGSPLLLESRALADGVAKQLGEGWIVELGMRYGAPSVAGAVAALCEAGVSRSAAVARFAALRYALDYPWAHLYHNDRVLRLLEEAAASAETGAR